MKKSLSFPTAILSCYTALNFLTYTVGRCCFFFLYTQEWIFFDCWSCDRLFTVIINYVTFIDFSCNAINKYRDDCCFEWIENNEGKHYDWNKIVKICWCVVKFITKRTVWNKGQHTKVKFSEEEKMHVTNSVQDLTTCNE